MKSMFKRLAVGSALLLGAASFAQAQVSSTDDFESGLSGWNAFINVFDSTCATYQYGYPYSLPNAQVAAVADDGSGSNNILNVFANYDDPNLGNTPPICQVSSVFQEATLTAGDAADYTFSYDLIPGATPQGPTTRAFIKLLDPGAGFATVYEDYSSTSGTGSGVMSITIDASQAQAGLILQWGFDTQQTGYDPSGRWYDNVRFGTDIGGALGQNTTTAVPTLPIWGLFGLVAIVGWLGSRRKR